jgi:putative transport protein
MSPGAQAVGFALFIFSVGYQAGPRFFDVLRTDGLKDFSLALVIALSGLMLATLGAWWLELEPGTSAGLLAGGLTSSPTLAAAQEAIRGGTVSTPEGWTADAVIGNITTGYAITYIFGLAGRIAIIKLLPGMLKIDLKTEAKRMESEDRNLGTSGKARVNARAYRVSNEAFTQSTIGELRERLGDGVAVARLRREGEFLTPSMQLGDKVFIFGDVELFTPEVQAMGEEITAQEELNDISHSAQVIVTNSAVVGKSLAELNINRTYHVLVTDVRRMRISIPRDRSMQLSKGDILTVLGTRSNIDQLGQELGQVERDVAETDMITFALGIAAGVLLGLLSVKIGGVSVGLGSAGGLLASGLNGTYLRE